MLSPAAPSDQMWVQFQHLWDVVEQGDAQHERSADKWARISIQHIVGVCAVENLGWSRGRGEKDIEAGNG